MSEFEPRFTPTFLKETRKMKGEVRKELEKSILKIVNDPKRGKPLHYLFHGCRSERIGMFRIIYEIVEDTIVFHYFEHRKTIYRK